MKEQVEDKKIYRSKDDYLIAGVCGGLASFFKIDSTLVRVIFILLVLSGGSGFLIYLILWLIIPKEGGKMVKVDRDKKIKEFANDLGDKAQDMAKEIKREINYSKKRGSFFGLVLIILGGIVLVNKLFPVQIDWEYVWPGILIFLGLYLMARK